MTEGPNDPDLPTFLAGIAAELAEIDRGSDYSLWRSEAKHRVQERLIRSEPFSAFATSWVFSGDGAGSVVGGRFGEWAIDQLLKKLSPEALIARFNDEVARNVASYEDVSPVFGIEITEGVDLGHQVRLVPAATDILQGEDYSWRFAWPNVPTGTGFLVQSYSVTPAFEARPPEATGPSATSVTTPDLATRQEVRRRVRLACILGSSGAVELPMTVVLADRDAALAVGGAASGRPFDAQPVTSFAADLTAIAELFAQLASFTGDVATLSRAIDRLGRSRLAVHPVDRALDLGIAAEIVLMHDQGRSNTEITYKIASRAAWLLGTDPEERKAIFDQIKHLYGARSTAVHSGVLPSSSKVDLDAADALVVRVIRDILRQDRFPDWAALTLGGS